MRAAAICQGSLPIPLLAGLLATPGLQGTPTRKDARQAGAGTGEMKAEKRLVAELLRAVLFLLTHCKHKDAEKFRSNIDLAVSEALESDDDAL